MLFFCNQMQNDAHSLQCAAFPQEKSRGKKDSGRSNAGRSRQFL